MIQINGLNFNYARQKALFSDLSLQLEPGSITGLLGKNGAGKTSLLKLLTGLLHPQSGEVSVISHNPKNREVSFLNNVYLVPEEFYFPAVKVSDYIKAYGQFYPYFDHSMLDKILIEFEIVPDSNLQHLSHGQKKKFLIGFAISTRCRLLILDEPTNGLDIPSKALFRKILAGSLEEDHLIVISTHQVKDVENLIDKILILDNGKMIFQQTLADISQKVCFISGTSADMDGTIYSEEIPGGYRMMKPNGIGETEVDIELLFNAIIQGKKIE